MRVHTNEKETLDMNNSAAVKKYMAKLDEFKIRPYKDEGQKIRDWASAHGMSVQRLFLDAVAEYMTNHKDD